MEQLSKVVGIRLTEEEYDKAYQELVGNLREQYDEDVLIENALYDRVFEFLRTKPSVNLVGKGQ